MLPDLTVLVPLLMLAALAGAVRGFAGFGTGLVFMPIAAMLLPPVAALVILSVMDGFGGMRMIPEAWKVLDRRSLAFLIGGMLIGTPLGVWLLTSVEPETFRWIVSASVLAALIAIASGWRYSRKPGAALTAGIGGTGGVMGGFMGLPGPPVILMYLGGPQPPDQIRAGITLFLAAEVLVVLIALHLRGALEIWSLVTGAALIAPYLLTNWLGSLAFRRWGGGLFRPLAYIVMGAAALIGLPLFD
nr:sulfite exporter TauE/SafE family protein [Rubricella aquisinus]